MVGAGPGGTAAAFRARELGLSLLVVDHDDVLKRIRDYSKDKLILPSFGGGDSMRFPGGGELVRRLYFGPIDKDEMHDSWKDLYGELDIPLRIGVELNGLEEGSDGIWAVRTWDHDAQEEVSLYARHVVLSIGRGVPRRFDIPGNTDGIAPRLDDPSNYVGRPVCVVGGGTSAAEAVIAISRAKAEAEDPTRVHWSYRGTRLPRVSKALADVFFEAYVGNGNISYHPLSEPLMVVTGDDHREYLALRVDRKQVEGRLIETELLEVPKEDCIVCIGEDIPERLLSSMGISMVSKGGKRKRMVVNRMLETVLPRVYMVGDILSQAYLETDDFTADPSTYREVRHRGNIKSALRDGVLVAQVVAQRLEGRTEIDLELGDAPDELVPEDVTPAPRTAEPRTAAPRTAAPVAAASSPGKPAPREDDGSSARLVRLHREGVEGDEVELPDGGRLTIGRTGCDLSFPTDENLGDHHASLVASNGEWTLVDEGSETGTFRRAPAGESLLVGDRSLIRAGSQILVLVDNGARIALRHYDLEGRNLGEYPIEEGSAIFGRESPDVDLDPDDGVLSRRHFSIVRKEGEVRVRDLGSANGTHLLVTEPVTLGHDDEFRLGREVFRFLAPGAGRSARTEERSSSISIPRPAPSGEGAGEEGNGGPGVTFGAGGSSFPLQPGQTVCDVAESNGIALDAECHAGMCGSDPIRILEGSEHLDPPDDDEVETLEDLCQLEPGPCRLACKVRPRGPIVVEILKPER